MTVRTLPTLILVCLAALTACSPPPDRPEAAPAAEPSPQGASPMAERDPDPATAEVATLAAALADGSLTSEALVQALVDDIEARDADYRSVLALNPEAPAQARVLDAERAGGSLRGPLHGIPVLVKDNIEAAELPTTAGALILADNRTERDAEVIRRLREAGLVILGKTNLSEWANFRSTRSSSGWSAVGGQTRNAHDPTRSPCGSSSGSGTAVALGFAPLALGTETNGSVVCPSAVNGIVGVKPTVGLVSRTGIVPIAHSQDTAGPMTRSVRDAALLLTAMAGSDPADADTTAADERRRDYAATLDADALRGARLGVVRSAMGYHEGVDELFEANLERMRRAGAVIVDELELARYDGMGDDTYAILLHEFRTDLDAWFASLPNAHASLRLEDVIAFNLEHAETSMPFFRQEILERAAATAGVDDPDYRAALERARTATRAAIDGLLAEHDLDALIAPTEGPAWSIDRVNGDHFLGGFSTFPAVSGYPHVTVPMGRLHGLPLGLSFAGAAWSEAELLSLAHAFEQLGVTQGPAPELGQLLQ